MPEPSSSSISTSSSSSSPLAAALAEALARRLAGAVARPARRSSRSIAALLGRPRARPRAGAPSPAAIADLDQVAHDLLDVAADIADLGELGRLDLDERRVGQPRQPAADLGLAARRSARSSGCSWASPRRAARPAGCWRRQRLRSATATALLGIVLADDMRIERSNNGFGSKGFGHGNRPAGPFASADGVRSAARQISSSVTRSLVKTQTSAATCMARRAIFSASSS